MKKLFKNCPKRRRKNCVSCPLLRQCVAKKMFRVIKSRLRDVCLYLIIILSAIGIVLQINSIAHANSNIDSENLNVTIRTQEVTKCSNENKENKVKKDTSNSSEIIIVAMPEENETQDELKQEENQFKEEAKISADGPSDKYYYQISNSEKKDIEKLVYQESRGESLEGKVAVAAVVLNRYMSKDKVFNTTSVSSIVTQSGQFADISTVTQEQLNEVPECSKAVELALKGWDPTRKGFSEGAKYFYEPNTVTGYQKEIRQGIEVYQIGNHCFHNDFNY